MQQKILSMHLCGPGFAPVAWQFVLGLTLIGGPPAAWSANVDAGDPRNIRTGVIIPDEGYCDQPYVVVTKAGHWLCVMTTGKGHEGQTGQHVVATLSHDQGRTWSELIDIEPADGPEASWAMPLIVPSGRVYVFYDYNGDRVNQLGDRVGIRADMLGWYVYKYSDDHGRTWSKQRYRLPVRFTEYDRTNDFDGQVQMFWGIGKPIVSDGRVFFGFSKIGKYVVNQTEGWFFRSDNILTEPDPNQITWQMLPDGDAGLRSPHGPIAEEQNLVPLKNGRLYTMYRTVAGWPCHAYSDDGGHTWTGPAYATYTPGGRRIENPRACPRLWKCRNGKYLFWFHNHNGKDFNGRNPAWVIGGEEVDGHLHWSQPEILVYDPDPKTRISYPDLIEENGRYWVTETQKSVARVHAVDPSLFEGLWQQGKIKRISKKGLVVSWSADDGMDRSPTLAKLPALAYPHGLTVDVRLKRKTVKADQPLVDTRDEQGNGWALVTEKDDAVALVLRDGEHRVRFASDAGSVPRGKQVHVVAVVDAGPRIITFVIDGVLGDGGADRQFGWGRFDAALQDINGRATIDMADPGIAHVHRLRVYDRALRTGEAVSHYHAGANANSCQ